MAMNYWEKRALQRLKEDIRDADEVLKLIYKSYDKALHDIEKEIADLFYRYSDENRFAYSQASKMLTSSEFKKFRMSIDEYARLCDDPNILFEINTLSTRTRISRLQALFFDIMKIVNDNYVYQNKAVEELMKSTLENNLYTTMYDANKAGISNTPTIITMSELTKELERPWSGKNFSERIWKNTKKIQSDVEEMIVQSAIQGYDHRKLTKKLSERFNVSKKIAYRLVHTEHSYMSNTGKIKAYNSLGVDRFKFSATLDIKTSETCREHDGNVYKLDDAIAGINVPPLHPHCRSTTVPYVDDLDGTRIARDVNGNNTYVDKNLTYDEWHRKYVESNPEYALKEKMWKNRYADKKQHKKYLDAGVDVPKSFAEFQKMKYNNKKELDDILYRNELGKSVFPSEKSLNGHYEKHGKKMGYSSKEEYQKGAQKLLSKKAGNDVYRYTTENGRTVVYDEKTNEIVIFDQGKIKTHLKPDDGIEYYYLNKGKDEEYDRRKH